MARFLIDTSAGHVVTRGQLIEAGIASAGEPPPRPWLEIQGSDDASTMWYAVMRRRERGVFIGTLALRHGGHHASLLQSGWEEVPPAQIGAAIGAARTPSPSPLDD